MTQVRDVLAVIDRAAPLALQESWDNCGLLVGDPAASVTRLLVALDHTEAVVKEARRLKAELLVTHHPLFLPPLKRLCPDTHDGRIALDLAAAGVALIAAHTNYDAARDGLNDILARSLGLMDTVPLVPAAVTRATKLVVFVPPGDLDRVERAAFDAGAGHIGQYSQCSFRVSGSGTFLGGESTHPAVGTRGRRQQVDELRVETVVPTNRVAEVAAAVRAAHSYETPALDLYPLDVAAEGAGLGRAGKLVKAVALKTFVDRVRRALGAKTVEVVGSLKGNLERAAVLGGAGGDYWPQALAAGAQVLVTGEMKHHERLAAVDAGMVAIVAGHYATEHPAVAGLAKLLRAALPDVKVQASAAEKNPTTWS
ncbi:MAG TPA: Nif3-like dinuclear metal center hexameric protein [Phycisphaerae bacterium]|nr:Nif3-like dinuclear metal center hexameric protein [Phycisphaerae bacterium]HOI55121.1 Nif3-like dinuclear metal center hexameric protein [Phycisphaerae bacterium]